MEDFASILVRDYGLKPQGKSAPMSSTKLSPGVGSSRGSGYGNDRKGSLSGRMTGSASTFGGQEDVPYTSRKNGSNKMSGRSTYGGGGDDIFSPGNYDDVFGGPPKSSAAGPRYDDVFGEAPDSGRAPVYDDLFGGLGVSESKGKVPSPRVGSPRRSDRSNSGASESAAFDELLPGFSSEPVKSRSSGDATASHDEDPFVPPLVDDPLSTTPENLNSAPFIDPMDVFTVPPINASTDAPRASGNASGAFDGFDIFDGFTNQSSVDASKPVESSQSSRDDLRKSVEDVLPNHSPGTREQSLADETEPSERDLPTVEPTEAYNISSKSSPFFSFKSDDGAETTAPSVSSSKLGEDALFSSPLDSPVPFKAARPRSSPFGDVKEKWLTVNDMKLVTKPSSIPPPSRPPPVPGAGRYGSRSRVDHMESSGQEDRFMSSSWPSANTVSAAYANSSEEEQTGGGTPGGSRKDFFGRMDYKANVANNSGDDEKDVEEDAAAVKAREKEKQEKERQEREAKEAEAREDRERERARRYREKEREREKDRAAVQRVTLEARERAAQEARERAQRTAVERATSEARERAAQQAQERAARERAAVEKANAEARERAEQRAAMEKAAKERAEQRAAVERAATEARERAERVAVERAQAEARERAERAASERAQQEARQRAERAAAERASQEVRQRAAAEARERAEKEAAEKAAWERREQEQRRSEHDLDAFFNPGLQKNPPSSEPKRSASVNNMSSMNYDPNGVRRSMNNSRPSSVPSADYLRSLLEDPVPQPTSNSGEDPVRNKRSGAADRSRDRAQKALEEIKKREAEMQREQAEKHRAADQLDAEIKRWAAGKEGNLRALLSTLQYVLWPECGWQPVSLSDLITAGSVKKTYRKATLVVHPDKVQQKGATVQHKYIAEKVFDLLKEAWNKFNSEELF